MECIRLTWINTHLLNSKHVSLNIFCLDGRLETRVNVISVVLAYSVAAINDWYDQFAICLNVLCTPNGCYAAGLIGRITDLARPSRIYGNKNIKAKFSVNVRTPGNELQV